MKYLETPKNITHSVIQSLPPFSSNPRSLIPHREMLQIYQIKYLRLFIHIFFNEYVRFLMNRIHNNLSPVDRLDVAEGGILLNPHSALHDVGEAEQAKGPHVLHLVDSQSVVVNESMTSNDRQLGKDTGQVLDLVCPVEEQVVRDLNQVGERKVEVIFSLENSFN